MFLHEKKQDKVADCRLNNMAKQDLLAIAREIGKWKNSIA